MAVPKTFTGGERLFAEDLNDNFTNLDVRTSGAEADIDNIQANYTNAATLTSGTLAPARMPSGTIVQTKVLYFDTAFITSFPNSTPVLVPGFALSITPLFADSKLLVVTTAAVSSANSESYFSHLRRKIGSGSFEFNHNNSRIIRGVSSVYETRHAVQHYTSSFLDSPASTEEVTYQFFVASSGPGSSLSVNRSQIEDDRRGNSYMNIFEVRP